MSRNCAVQKITLDAKAGEVSAELVRRGVAADARVRALVEVVGEDADLPPMAAVAEAGGAFDWLADEPDLYTDPDLPRPGQPGGVCAFGSIVLIRFPFTGLSGGERRPALVVSRDNEHRADVVVCFITSVQRAGPDTAPIAPTPGTGLKVPSVVRFDKIATLGPAVVAGKLGEAPSEWLSEHRTTFIRSFGFRRASPPASEVPLDQRIRRASEWAARARVNLDLFAFLMLQENREKYGDALEARCDLFEFLITANEHQFLARVANLFAARPDTDNFHDLLRCAKRTNAINEARWDAIHKQIVKADKLYKMVKIIRNKVVAHQDSAKTKIEVYEQQEPTLNKYIDLSDRSIAIAALLCSERGLRPQPAFRRPVEQLEEMLAQLQRAMRAGDDHTPLEELFPVR